MRAVLQRVSEASVVVNGQTIGAIQKGCLVLLCAMPNDGREQVDKLLDKVARLRIFPDEEGKMNRSLEDIQGGLLLVSQFTLAADTAKGTRPGFSAAASPAIAKPLFDYACERVRQRFKTHGFGEFGADMQVSLVNDGPVTLQLEVE